MRSVPRFQPGRAEKPRPVRWPLATVATMALLLAACGDDDTAGAGDRDSLVEEDGDLEPEDLPANSDEVGPVTDLADLDLDLTEVAEFDEPLALVPRPNDNALFVAERDGRVIRLAVEGTGTERTYTPDPEPVVDLGDEVVSEGEQGLLGLAFSPDGSRLYLSYSLAPEGDTRVVSYEYLPDGAPDDGGDAVSEEAGTAADDVDGESDESDESDDDESDDTGESEEDEEDEDAGGGTPSVAGVDEATRREVIDVEQFAANHNGGQILFGPDGYLYLALGDGGGAADPEGNGQDVGTLLGSILRIDPEGAIADGAAEDYLIPEDNPFADGADGAQPEIWLYGVRNPWRPSFDAVTGDLWVADVGQGDWEEINLLPAEDEDHPGGSGANLGWNEMEASYPFDGGSNPSGAVLPVFEYPINGQDACAVTGGYAYSGREIPGLDGAYLFGDWCDPQVRALTVADGAVTGETALDGVEVEGLVSFGQDNQNELYLLAQSGAVHRLDPAG